MPNQSDSRSIPPAKKQKPPQRAALSCFLGPGLPLGELLCTPRLVQAHFLAFDLARITRHQPGLGQRRLERGVVFDQGAGEAVTHRTGLAGLAAAVYVA